MLFWIIFIVMLAVAVLSVLLPLARKQSTNASEPTGLEVYVEQLADIEARISQSQTPDSDLELERAEIARRILKLSRVNKNPTSSFVALQGKSQTFIASLIALIALPAVALGTYLYTGSPDIPDQPLNSDVTARLEDRSVEEMVIMAERHLRTNPDDVQGWTVLAGVYKRMNRPLDRARALQQVLRLAGPSPNLLTDLGEALTIGQDNIVPTEAREMFQMVLEMEPDHIRGNLYFAIALEQEGKLAKSLDRWNKLRSFRQQDQNWQAMVEQRVSSIEERLNSSATPSLPGPTRQDVENAANLSQADRMSMIETMVSGLAAKLEEDPDNLEGWKRLIRSYTVLNRHEDARIALKKARASFSGQSSSVQQIDQLANQLELNAENKGAGE